MMRYRIGELVEIIDGDRGVNYPKQDEFFDEGYCLFLNTGNVTKNGFSFSSNQFITQEKDSKLRKGKLTRNDIVYTTRGTVGNAAFYSPSVEFENVRINSGMIIIRKKDKAIDQNYFYQALKSDTYRNIFLQYCSGSAQPQLPIKTFSKIKIDIPDISTQEKIADILSTYDDLIENNNKRIKLLEQMAENLYKEWFVRFRFPNHENTEFENGLPNGWYVEKLGNLCNIITGKKDANQATGNGEYPFFTCARETTLFTDEYILDKNAILISGNGSYTGLVKKYSGKFDLYQRTYALYGFKNVEWLYAYWTLKINFEREFMGGSHGCAIPYITRPNIEKFKVVIPSKDLLLKAQQIFENIHNECYLLEKQNKNLIKQRDLLLPRLMSGKLEV